MTFAKISQKLHEIERIWAPKGARVPRTPLRSVTEMAGVDSGFPGGANLLIGQIFLKTV